MKTIQSLRDFPVAPFVTRNYKLVGEGVYGKVYTDKRKVHYYKVIKVQDADEIPNICAEINVQQSCHKIRTNDDTPAHKMALIPEIFRVWKTGETFPLNIVVEMEDAGYRLRDMIQGKRKPKYLKPTHVRQMCLILCQVAALIELLQKRIQFCHRDIHLDNILAKDVRGQNMCGDNLFCSYMIDFGMARATIDGNVVHSDSFFTTYSFTPSFDMTLLVFHIFAYYLKCSFQSPRGPRDIPQIVVDEFRDILLSTGIAFDEVANDPADLYLDIIAHDRKNEKTTPSYVQKKSKRLVALLCNL